jgi:hypothetical protein
MLAQSIKTIHILLKYIKSKIILQQSPCLGQFGT